MAWRRVSIALLAVLACGEEAAASICDTKPPEWFVKNVHAVFIGTVRDVEIKYPPPRESTSPDGRRISQVTEGNIAIHANVLKVLKGTVDQKAVIRGVAANGSNHGIRTNFRIGEEVRFYAYGGGGEFESDGCAMLSPGHGAWHKAVDRALEDYTQRSSVLDTVLQSIHEERDRLSTRANFLEEWSDFEGAARLRDRIALLPENERRATATAYALFLRHKFGEALPLLEAAVRNDPTDETANPLLAQSRALLGDRSLLQSMNYRLFRQPYGMEINLREMDLSGRNFSGSRLTRPDLTLANLHQAWMQAAQFDGAKLAYATLTHAMLTDLFSRRSDFSGANLREAQLAGAYFRETKFSGANLMGISGDGVVFEHSDFTNARLAGARLHTVQFAGSKFVDVEFADADLSGAQFTNTDLGGANLSSAKIDGAAFVGARYDCATRMPPGFNKRSALMLPTVATCDGKPNGIDFSGKALGSINLGRISLRGANFSRTMIDYGFLAYSDFSGANFAGSRLNASLWDSVFEGADFTSATLGGSPTNTNLRAADLTDATLEFDAFVLKYIDTTAAIYSLGTKWRSDVDINLLAAERRMILASRRVKDPPEWIADRIGFPGSELHARYVKAHVPRLSGQSMSGANLRAAWLWKASMIGTALRGADLRQAYLAGANLTNADLTGADLREAILDGAMLDGARYDETTRWPHEFAPPPR